MHDNPNPRHDPDTNSAEQAASGAMSHLDEEAREIPATPAPEPVHRWLDGESVNPQELGAPDAEKHVKFWAKVNAETERRRRLKTPQGLDAIIMDKLEPPVVKDD